MSLCSFVRRLIPAAPAEREGAGDRIRSVDAQTAIGWWADGKTIIVDVREPQEHKAGHIPGALLIPLSSFDPAAVPADSEKRLVFHCQSGKRCGPAADRMMAAGFTGTVHRLNGGMSAWLKAGGPVER